MYFYTEKGVYRKSNHWGRVANCRWKLISNENYKTQNTVIGFAKWRDFYPINSTEKQFFIEVNFEKKSAKLKPKKNNSTTFLFSFSEAQKKTRQINHLLKNDNWAQHFDIPLEDLQQKIITKFINSNKTLQEIKRSFK